MTRRPEEAADSAAFTRCATGSVGALEWLYAHHGAACLARAGALLCDPKLAEDAVRAAFLELWRHPGRYDARQGSIRSWLLMLTHRSAVDRLGNEERQHARTTPTFADKPAISNRLGEHARAALTRLAPVNREALILAYWGGYTQGEIATLTGVPLGTVKARMNSALRELHAPYSSPPREQTSQPLAARAPVPRPVHSP